MNNFEERITRNRRRCYFERINGKLRRVSVLAIREKIQKGEPVMIRRDLLGREIYRIEDSR